MHACPLSPDVTVVKITYNFDTDLLRTHQNIETCYKTDKTDIQSLLWKCPYNEYVVQQKLLWLACTVASEGPEFASNI